MNQRLVPEVAALAVEPTEVEPVEVERRGRRWIFGSFVLCPCHLPLTLAALGALLGGTALGAVLRDHTVLAAVIITAAWVAGTARGFVLVRMAERGTCPPRRARRWGRNAVGSSSTG